MPPPDSSAIERVARESYGKLVAILAAELHDVAAAEDALGHALLKALTRWPERGIPESPEAWLLVAARRSGIDELRRSKRELRSDSLQCLGVPAHSATDAGSFPDRRLALLFVCSHPAIEASCRAPLILQTVLGFDAERIAQAFLVSPTAMAQRLVRAKRKIKAAGIPFALPGAADLLPRLEAVLESLYACYTEGWSTSPGGDGQRRDLAGEAIWLGRLLVQLCPKEPEALGLLALLLHLESRSAARFDRGGEFIPLSEQDPERWDRSLIREAEALLRQAAQHGTIGRFQIEAAIQSAHASRVYRGTSDWPSILQLYEGLARINPSPVVSINRAVAVAEVHGTSAGLAILGNLPDAEQLATYQPLWAARAHLLARAGETAQAASAYRRAIDLSRDVITRHFLENKLAELGNAAPSRN